MPWQLAAIGYGLLTGGIVTAAIAALELWHRRVTRRTVAEQAHIGRRVLATRRPQDDLQGVAAMTANTTCGHRDHGALNPCVLSPNHSDNHADETGRTWFNRGPLQHYEIIWMSGHVETVPAHQVSYPHRGLAVTAFLSGAVPEEQGRPRVQLHAEIDGQWLLTLSALEEDIRSMRLVTVGEEIPQS